MAKRYKCQYCDYHGTKEDLIDHMEDKHEELIPEGYTAGRCVFNHINGKTHGTCIVCKRETAWNEERLKYNRLCGREQCKKALREKYSKNMINVHGTDNLLTNMERQELMLQNRRISGTYKFQDGGVHTYCGSYEKKTLEFLDTVLGYKSSEILSPGPIFEYEYKGKKLKWITDIMIIPYNLVMDIKDGGDNKNNREMPDYREKQIAKEAMIRKLNKFNYLRLTNNNFEQLMHILAELKSKMLSDKKDENAIISVNEEVQALYEAMSPLRIMTKDDYTEPDFLDWFFSHDDFRNISIEDTDLDSMFESVGDRRVIGYFKNGKCIGVIDAVETEHPDKCLFINMLYTQDPGNGIGKILLKEVIGFYDGNIRLNVVASNTKAIKFYESNGFKKELEFEDQGRNMFLMLLRK